MQLKKWWLPVSAVLLMLITVASLLPVPVVGPPGSDKLHHFLSYTVLMLPAALAGNKPPLSIALFFLFWSGAIELIQPYVNRHGEWADLFANGIGLVIGLLLGLIVRRYLTKGL